MFPKMQIETPDDSTVVFKLSQSWGPFLEAISVHEGIRRVARAGQEQVDAFRGQQDGPFQGQCQAAFEHALAQRREVIQADEFVGG